MKSKIFNKLLAIATSTALLATSFSTVPANTVSAATTPGTVTPRVSVHDPSIIKAEDGTYYVFGSHLADAKSTDLMKWSQMHRDWNGNRNWKTNSIYGDILTNLAESFKWAGYNDGDQTGGLGVWAPDIYYNKDYVWSDGSKGAYMSYYSASSTWRRSCIGYAVSKTVEGPYKYVDTIIYSGFTKDGATDGNSTRNTKWDNDYLNVKELIDNGTIEGISDKWFSGNGWNANYAPNAIDATIFDGKDGKLYMTYGSWSGGIFILELDPATGAPKYPGTDSTDSVSGNFVDRYFGTHIAGGNHQSGEGPFILYDEETDYYYLYETYGGLTAEGGYNMRLFRSKNVYGPYLDSAGRNAKDSGRNNNNYGIKLIGNYQFTGQQGYRAAGHNSALIDDDGQRYLFYHQRFTNKGEAHEVRVHQQFMNEDNWPVTAVYEYRGETIAHYESKDVVGTYEVINHGTSSDGNMLATQTIQLCADGTVTGDMTGTWKKSTGSGKSYDYITLSVGTTTYKGVLYKQFNESNSEVMTFSVIGNNNTSVWGTKTNESITTTPTENNETLSNTEWWNGAGVGKDHTLNGDGSIDIYVKAIEAGAFTVEAYDPGTTAANDGYYFTTGSDKNAWVAELATGTVSGVATNLSSDLVTGHTYKITITRSGNDIQITYFDETAGAEYCTLKLTNSNMPENLNVHIIAQIGTYNVYTIPKEPTTDTPINTPSTEDSDTSNADKKQGSISNVKVKAANQKPGTKTVYLKKGKKVSLAAEITGTGSFTKGVTWKSSKKKIASVSNKGVVTAKKPGTAKITVTSKFDKTKKATIIIKVSKKAKTNKKLVLKKKSVTLKKSKTYTVAIKKMTKKTTDPVVFKSSAKKIVSVDKFGLVTAKKKGNAKITVQCGKKKATLTIKVK